MQRRNIKAIIKFGIISASVIVIIAYTYYKSQNLINGPRVTIDSPQTGALLHSPITEIIGDTKNINAITLNDRSIFIDDLNKFREKILLSEGYNVLTIKAKDKFGRTTEKKIELVYKP